MMRIQSWNDRGGNPAGCHGTLVSARVKHYAMRGRPYAAKLEPSAHVGAKVPDYGIFVMKVRDVIKLLVEDGWFLVAQSGSHRQYRHPTKPGRVTVAGSPGLDLAAGTLGSVIRQAGIEVERR
jgi:predicted RNA binding protein YcfA (HicA-like mRNA interferase family)